jgi:hypothetical protein
VQLSLRVVGTLAEVDRATWDALDHGPSPFTEYGFLRALELSGSVDGDSGWYPHYVLAEDPAGALVGAVAAYVKTHSYGEYIFDFEWARASLRSGIDYYPKLVVAVPVTPATGRRLLIARDVDRGPVATALAAGVRELAERAGCSSVHWLFCARDEQAELSDAGYAPRASYQFHWHNRGYGCFDDFLAALASRKRKQFRKERLRAHETIDGLDWVAGDALADDDLAAMDRLYRRNVDAHWGEAYLKPGFFAHLRELAPERLWFARARRAEHTVAGAIFLATEQALYGRYWGCFEEHEFLHFETAYYAGIERCIERRVSLFEAGAQGEHKLLRGFAPSPTYSAHWFQHDGLDRAIRAFLREEARAVGRQMDELAGYLPYRRE